MAGIFPRSYLQLVNSSKNSILNWFMKLSIYLNISSCVFFVFFVFETPLKDFLFYSPIIFTLWFRYLQTQIKESCMYLSHQLFFKTPYETLKIPRKIQEKCIFQQYADLNFKNFPFVVYRGATSRNC